jgi:hypothetical protein
MTLWLAAILAGVWLALIPNLNTAPTKLTKRVSSAQTHNPKRAPPPNQVYRARMATGSSQFKIAHMYLLTACYSNALIPLLHGDRDEVAIDPDGVPGPTMVMTRIYDTHNHSARY